MEPGVAAFKAEFLYWKLRLPAHRVGPGCLEMIVMRGPVPLALKELGSMMICAIWSRVGRRPPSNPSMMS